MKLSSREMVLGWLTMAALLLGGTYLVGQAKVREWRETQGDYDTLKRRIRTAERVLDKKDEWYQRLEEMRGQLPHHAANKDVTADLLKMLERTAQDHGLTLLQRKPEREKSLGDLYEVAIACTWEGELDQLIHFLYAIQSKGAILDIQQLTVAPVPRQQGRLKGSFTVDCAFSRESAEGNQVSGLQVTPTP